MKFLAIHIKKLYDENRESNIHSNTKEGVHMDYKRMIVEMLQKIDDEKVLSFIYKIISNLMD